MLLSFEGLDFCGKSTQIRLLESWMNSRGDGRAVLCVREPGGTHISERVRDVLLDPRHEEMSEVAELFLFSAARAQLVRQLIIPALQHGENVVCDRYHDSTTAYQGYGRGIDIETITRINQLATAGVMPDATVYLDITPKESYRRRALRLNLGTADAPEARSPEDDRMEQSGLAFYARVREGYLAIARAEPERFHVIDGTRTVESIAEEIRAVVSALNLRIEKAGKNT